LQGCAKKRQHPPVLPVDWIRPLSFLDNLWSEPPFVSGPPFEDGVIHIRIKMIYPYSPAGNFATVNVTAPDK